ncbi:TonB-dependent receptor domain-containing protein [Chryseobacterium sp. PTM-20240506]|uniref:TonB-dependent receptor domain-containing protein n=1 Tax=unclassified Chryseobacterium TaxID=2593645 RepID=UPI002359CC05|nr:TonB-dependent receptor [Chryseobacterium sp. B21-037]MDC8105184.1 TonB-dependent receptor [Chryseobacterium sp. B21-037]
MVRKIFTFIFFLFSLFIYAQSIEGSIIDGHHKPAVETEVVITNDTEKFSAITDQNGMFKIVLNKNGIYLLEVIHDGIKVESEKITVSGNLTKDIHIKENTPFEQKIEGVSVSIKKKLFERKVDRLVFNVENSIASQGIDVVEALAKTPMVRATDDAISIAGKSNIAVMLNDRILNLSGQELINYLKTLRSDDVAKIEVITTPPAKYEAEGKSGLINIILKKKADMGWNGSLQTSGSYFYGKPTVSARSGAGFNYQGNKLSLTANLSAGDNYWDSSSYNYLTGTNNSNYWNTDSKELYNNKYKGANLKGEYKISDKHLVGFNYNYSFGNPFEKAENYTSIFNEGGKLNVFSDSKNKNHRNLHNTNAFYDIKLDTIGSKLSISGNVLINNAHADNFYNTVTDTKVSTLTNPVSRYRIYSGQADLEKNFVKIKTESGLKYTKIKNASDFNFFNIENGQYILNRERTNTFIYNEENFAAYLSTSFKINDKWDAKAGLRYEYTTLEGVSLNDNSSANINYGKFFPTAYLSYKPNENNTFTLNYSRRISRPYFGNLNPFKYYTSEYEYNTGNPYLLPSFSDNFELGYVLKNNLNITLYYNYNKDNWDRIQVVEGNLKYSIVKNFYNQNQAGINISYNYNKLTWLESSAFLNGFYAKSKSYLPEAVAAPAGYGASINLDNNFFLNKEKTLTLMLGIWANIPNRSGNTYFNGNGSVYTGIKLNLMEKKLMINLYLNDALNTDRNKGTEYYPNYNVEYYSKGTSRNMLFSVTYKFGNNDIKGATKQMKFEESNRAGGSNGN